MIRREQRGGDAQGRAADGGPGGSQAVKEPGCAVPQGKAASRSWWWQAELGVLHPLSPLLEVG